MTSTIRRCNTCGYETLIMNDDEERRECKYCGGSLEIRLIEI